MFKCLWRIILWMLETDIPTSTDTFWILYRLSLHKMSRTCSMFSLFDEWHLLGCYAVWLSSQPPSALSTTGQAKLSRLPAFVGIIFNRISRVLARHNIKCGLAPHEIIQSPPSDQRSPWTKDTRCLQDPIWVRQYLHWAVGPFRGH
jgi:hypothetical protein